MTLNEVSTQFWAVNILSDFISEKAQIMCGKLGGLPSATPSQVKAFIPSTATLKFPGSWVATILFDKQRPLPDRGHTLACSSALEAQCSSKAQVYSTAHQVSTHSC